MPYNSENGIISAPVSIDDVKQALRESSNDLATLCKNENINIWSKYKPISCKGEFKEYPIREDSDEIVTSSFSKYTCVVRCGMNIPMDTYKNLRNNYGEEGFAIKACEELHKDNVYGVSGIDKDASTNSHTVYASGKHFPKGGTNSPYRLGDFRNYNAKAIRTPFLTSFPQFNNIEVYYSSTPKFNCVLYKSTDMDDNTNVTMDDIITDLSLAWSFWIQIRYNSPYNTTDKIYKNYYVGNCKKPTDYIYASREITFDIGSGDKVITVVPFLAYTRNATLYDDTKIIFISLPGGISFKYYPRQIYMESIKSGSSGFVDFSSLRELFGSCICKARIYKTPDTTFTITDGIFRSVCTYGNNKTTYGRGYVSNSSGQDTGSVTIPKGDRTDYVETYIRFDYIYDGGYYGQRCQLSFEINIDGGWKQIPPGGSYIMR